MFKLEVLVEEKKFIPKREREKSFGSKPPREGETSLAPYSVSSVLQNVRGVRERIQNDKSTSKIIVSPGSSPVLQQWLPSGRRTSSSSHSPSVRLLHSAENFSLFSPK